MRFFVLFSLGLLLFSYQLNAQVFPRFKAGLIAGLNFAELEGEGITDYQGLNAGMIVSARLNKGLQFSTEILFSQNGEYILPAFYPQIQYGRITLNHIEVPFHLDVLIRAFQGEKFEDWQLHFGGAYTRIFHHFAETYDGFDVSDQIVYSNRKAFQAQVGTTYFFSKKIGLNLKTSLPFSMGGLDVTLAARMVYIFEI